MVAPLVGGVSKVMEFAGTPKLDEAEREGGTQAFSALMYQYGGVLDARVLVAMWIIGVSVPRALWYMQQVQEKKELAAKTRASLTVIQHATREG